MAKVVRFHEPGGPEVLRIDEVARGAPKAGDVRIRVGAIGLNRVEALFRSGAMGVPALPSTLGYEAAGVIEAVGAGVTAFQVGDRAATLPGLSMEDYGTYADVIFYPADMLVALPDALSLETAAAAWMQYLTAYALVSVAAVRPGDAVVITAASSSVGVAAIQIANLLGAVPIAVTRGRGKAAALAGLGARHVVVTEEQDLAATVSQLTGGAGARVVFDAVAGETLPQLVELAAFEGVIILYGMLAGVIAPLPAPQAMQKALTIRGFSMNHLLLDPAQRSAALDFVRRGLASGQLAPVIDSTFTLEEIVAAHRRLESNAQLGKIIVRTA
ncbi:zinc-dependent alcohol dehydrogenase family protein [Phenylobacterium sp. LjRoot219]|uniref:zinc-dependent alcohol dehydrogenase family protein n=1 Tax=Phenylobacterium sp. LjRoot219 TaxID=3342283 RepID=UPI003ECDC8C5